MQARFTEGIWELCHSLYMYDAKFRIGVSFTRRFSFVIKVLKVAVI